MTILPIVEFAEKSFAKILSKITSKYAKKKNRKSGGEKRWVKEKADGGVGTAMKIEKMESIIKAAAEQSRFAAYAGPIFARTIMGIRVTTTAIRSVFIAAKIIYWNATIAGKNLWEKTT